MKYICERTSAYKEKPCDEARQEEVSTYFCRTLPKEEMAIHHKNEDFTEYENITLLDGRSGCRKKEKMDAYTVEINNIEQLMDFIKKHGEIIIYETDRYDFPVIEIYDTWRE